VLDAELSKRSYLLGNKFSVADLNVAAVISRAVDMDLSAVPNLKSWLTRCLDRAAAREALALKAQADAATPADVTRQIAKINRL
jgi:glutathione S-transferase